MRLRPTLVAAFCAIGSTTPAAALPGGAERLEYRYGPLEAAPGHNLILVGPVTVEQPREQGFITRIEPGVLRPDGKVPPVEQVHMHHAVMLNMSRPDLSDPSVPGERFYAFAEE